MAATLGFVAILFVLLALPEFPADHRMELLPLVVLSLALSAGMVVALPVALFRGGTALPGLRVVVACYVGLLVIEPFTLRDPLPAGATPWLLGLSLIAFSCAVVSEVDPLRSGAVCTGLNIALACVYADRFPLGHTLVTSVGLEVLVVGLIAGVRALRVRADHADTIERQAQALFETQQRDAATEAERVRTDALLHDTVLAALLAAAGNHDPARTTRMAREALEVVASSGVGPPPEPPVVRFGLLWSSVVSDLALPHDAVRFALTDLDDAALPPEVGDALVSATMQALVNSVRHAGPGATRSVVGSGLAGGGVRITITDDGQGFDPASVSQERLGVRVSILERVRTVGGTAQIRSAPGKGATVVLEWHPDQAHVPLTRRPGESLLTFFGRRRLYQLLGGMIVVAVLIAIVDAVFNTHGYASIGSSVLGLLVLPMLVRGARLGVMSNRAAWTTTGVAVVLCAIAPIGLTPAQFDATTIARYTCGVLAGAAMLWMAGRRLPALIVVTTLVA